MAQLAVVVAVVRMAALMILLATYRTGWASVIIRFVAIRLDRIGIGARIDDAWMAIAAMQSEDRNGSEEKDQIKKRSIWG